jgi:DNA repair exonuclease SbcCD ATPase subunit
MNKKNILDANSALDNLEQNSSRLSDLVHELTKLKGDLSVLKDAVKQAHDTNQEGNERLSAFTKTVEEVQDKLAQEIRLRITESVAEQNSRLKDANEKITALDTKLEVLKTEVLQNNSAATKVLSEVKQINQSLISFRNKLYLFLILILAPLIYLLADKFGFN